MTTRNFWIEGRADGIKTPIGTGPRARDGGFELRIKMRDNGGIITPLVVRGFVRNDGTLELWVNDEMVEETTR